MHKTKRRWKCTCTNLLWPFMISNKNFNRDKYTQQQNDNVTVAYWQNARPSSMKCKNITWNAPTAHDTHIDSRCVFRSRYDPTCIVSYFVKFYRCQNVMLNPCVETLKCINIVSMTQTHTCTIYISHEMTKIIGFSYSTSI